MFYQLVLIWSNWWNELQQLQNLTYYYIIVIVLLHLIVTCYICLISKQTDNPHPIMQWPLISH